MEFNYRTAVNNESPFFALMSEAEQIQVQEVPDKSIAESNEKAFLVKIRPRQSSYASKNEPELLANAQLLLSNGDYLLARNLFSFVLRKNLKDEQAMEGLGICFLQLKEPLAARKCFRALWDMHRRSRYAIYLGLCYLAEKDDEAAFSLFQQVTDEQSVEVSLLFEYQKAYGNLFMAREQWSEAEKCYLKAKDLRPDSAAVFANLGTLEVQRKNYQEAENYFGQALKLDPKNSKSFFGLGLIRWENHSTSEAKSYFEKALDCDCKNSLALRFLIKTQDSHPKKEALKTRIHQFLDFEPNNGEIRFQLAQILMQENKFGEASEQAEKAYRLLPHDTRIQKLKKMIIQNRHWGTP